MTLKDDAVTQPAMPLDQAAASAQPQSFDNGRGIAAMVLAMGCFVASDSLVKVVGRDINLGQVLLIRGLIASMLVLGAACAFGWLGALWATISGPLRGRLALRTLTEVGATMCFFTGMLRLPFADNAAIGQLAPLAVTAGAAVFLGERVGWRRWLATLIGFLGVLVIVKPGTSAFDWAALWTLASVGFIAARDLLTVRISASVPSHHIASITAFGLTIASLGLVAVQPWRQVAGEHVAILALAAIGALFAFNALVVGMRAGEISVVGPFRYTVIIFSVLIGWFAFREPLSASTIAGIVIIMAAGLYTIHREQVRKREARASAVAAATAC